MRYKLAVAAMALSISLAPLAAAEVVVLPPPPTMSIDTLFAQGMVLQDSETSGNYYTQRMLFSQPLNQLWFSWDRVGVPPTIYSVFVGTASGRPPLMPGPPCCSPPSYPIYYSGYRYDWLNGGVQIRQQWGYTAGRDEGGGTFRLYIPEGINYVQWTGRGVNGGLSGWEGALVSLTAVPEPQTYALVLTGLALLGLIGVGRSPSGSGGAVSGADHSLPLVRKTRGTSMAPSKHECVASTNASRHSGRDVAGLRHA